MSALNHRMPIWVGPWLLWLVLAAGCRVGPNYHPPQMALPTHWSEAGQGASTQEPAELVRWWTLFQDPLLDSLIERGVAANFDLKSAEARLRAGRALRNSARADFLPALDATASYTTARRSENALAFPVRLIDTATYQAGFDAAWELDVFGGKRRALEAADADLQAVEADLHSVQVSLAAEVARNYLELRGTQRRLAIAQENLSAQREALEIAQQRLDAGLGNELEVRQATAVVAATRSQVPALETLEKQSIHRLSVLLGQTPGMLLAELQAPGAIPPPPPEVPAGLPADILTRRPDVRRSERQLASATARIGAAKAEYFPRFFLTGTAGFQSLETVNLFSAQSEFWSAGPSLRWRLLEFPRLRAQVQAQTAEQELALAQFNQSVLLALEEVENALVASGREKERYQALGDEVEAYRQALDLANQLYTAGQGEYLNVLDAERSLYQAQDALAQSQAVVSLNLVALYKALGGGWSIEVASN